MALAGLGVAMKVNMIVVMLLIGLGTGIQPLLGYCYGAGNGKRYMDVLKFSLCRATFALPSARIILLKLLLRIKNGIPALHWNSGFAEQPVDEHIQYSCQ